MEISGSDASSEGEDAGCETVPISFDDEDGTADVSGAAATLFSAFDVCSGISGVDEGMSGKFAVSSEAVKDSAGDSASVLVSISIDWLSDGCAEQNSSGLVYDVSSAIHAGKSNSPQNKQSRAIILFTVNFTFHLYAPISAGSVSAR